MIDYMTLEEIEKRLPFIKLIITNSSVDAKSAEDMLKVCKESNMNFQNLTSNIQIHSDIVNEINKDNIRQKIEGDALITNTVGVPLLVFTADCVPIAFIDEKNKAIGVAHAGWKGTFKEIAQKTLDKMKKSYNTNPNDVTCVIGPSIGPCCYEVSKDLIEKFNTIITKEDEKFYIIKENKYYLDLWKINTYILKSSGVREDNIINMNLCTSCNCEKFHSYRKHDKTTKRVGLILQIK